jgi:hypothetical protein
MRRLFHFTSFRFLLLLFSSLYVPLSFFSHFFPPFCFSLFYYDRHHHEIITDRVVSTWIKLRVLFTFRECYS